MALFFIKSPSTPHFAKGEVKKRILSQSLKPYFQVAKVISCMFLSSFGEMVDNAIAHPPYSR